MLYNFKMSVFSVVLCTDQFLIYFFSLSLFFIITFLSELKIAYWICLTTYFQFNVVKYTSQFWFFFIFFFSNRYFMGLLDCCWPRIGERIQMAAVHYLCWCIYFCYIEYQTYLRVFRNFKCSHRKLSDYVCINVNRQLNILTHLFLM